MQKSGVTALAHLTCVGQDEENLRASINAFKASGIENILALRGDIPEGDTAPQTFPHASDLINAIRREGADFCIGGACYPEGHPESYNSDADIDGVRRKVESGCEFLTTQMFFDNNILYNYMFKLLAPRHSRAGHCGHYAGDKREADQAHYEPFEFFYADAL